MKKIILAMSFALCATIAVNAQSTYNEEVDAVQAMFGMEKKKLITNLIKMTPEQATKFWPVYDQYEIERKALGKKRIKLLEKLDDTFNAMTDAKADQVASETMKLGTETDNLLKKYHSKIKAAAGSEVAFEFYQAELYILTQIRASLMEEIPLYSTYKIK